ncbi:DNA-binding response regulator [Clostridium sp. AF37-5]|uniref:LytR/AlgR family response regulator transcription factor n=1 Tax=Clostridium sp. AF37-5 TaxID=2293016 RepID=UPI000E5500CE|nr:LytTR family DNA-binding domain-containing protein [Clostridium sp. AF37-5]RHO97771.1 DNA-binding response regulator [Clostridium sp. AF37-5]
MNIAICDDDKGVCSQLEGWIEQYNYENATRLYVDVYHSAETLQQQLQSGQWYDMLFLDIELPQKNGIELGQMIRSAWKMDLIYLVFISGKSNYCMDLFDVHPLNFHLKPLKHKDVVKDIDLVRERVNTGTLAFRYREDGVYKSVCLKDIVYFVGAGKGVEVHCKDGRVAFAGNSLQQLCDIYEKHGFSRCHKSYLINLNYVSEYSMSKVKMSDGKEIIIGKSRRKQFKDEFINHELMED